MLIRLVIEAVYLSLSHKIVISLRAERHRREARREKFTHGNCTLSTIHLGRPGLSYDSCDHEYDDYDWQWIWSFNIPSWAPQARSKAWEVFPWELYPPDDPPRPSRPGPSDDDDDDDDCVKAHWRAAHPSIEHSTHIPWSPPWEEHPSTSATSTWVLVLKQATL